MVEERGAKSVQDFTKKKMMKNMFQKKQVMTTPYVGWWLLGCAAMVFLMAVIGAATRLTESGLSMVEWRPLTGFLPPMSQEEWMRVFELYKASPEFQKINAWMSLSDFKSIFWWEFIHRVWGRLIGLVFFIPFAYFFFTKSLTKQQFKTFLGLLFLGGFQGFIGWFMVRSGLNDLPYVSPYRLTLHLGFAVVLFMLLLWIGWGQLKSPRHFKKKKEAFHWLSYLPVSMIFITILSGAFVAGNDAGLIYNEFPLMGGSIVPHEYMHMTPAWQAMFQHPPTVQFNHRLLAVITGIVTLIVSLRLYVLCLPKMRNVAMLSMYMASAVIFQISLGILTLIMQVPVFLGTLHQGVALVLLGLALRVVFQLRLKPTAVK